MELHIIEKQKHMKISYSPKAAAIADMLATSTEAEEDTPFPSGTAEETWKGSYKLSFISL